MVKVKVPQHCTWMQYYWNCICSCLDWVWTVVPQSDSKTALESIYETKWQQTILNVAIWLLNAYEYSQILHWKNSTLAIGTYYIIIYIRGLMMKCILTLRAHRQNRASFCDAPKAYVEKGIRVDATVKGTHWTFYSVTAVSFNLVCCWAVRFRQKYLRKYSSSLTNAVPKAPEAEMKSHRVNITFQSSFLDLFVLISTAALSAYKCMFTGLIPNLSGHASELEYAQSYLDCLPRQTVQHSAAVPSAMLCITFAPPNFALTGKNFTPHKSPNKLVSERWNKQVEQKEKKKNLYPAVTRGENNLNESSTTTNISPLMISTAN